MIQQRIRVHLRNKWRAYVVVIAVMGALGFGLRNAINADTGGDALPEGAYTLAPTLTLLEIGGGGESVWVTVIRNNEPVWVRLDGAVIALPQTTPIPTASPTMQTTPNPAHTPTRTPAHTPTSIIVEVTPSGGTPTYPRTVKAERDYMPLVNLIVRTSPERTSTNGTTERAAAGTPYTIYHIREYADGSAWGCMTDSSDWRACVRWIAIKADLSPVDGVLEEYARATQGPVE